MLITNEQDNLLNIAAPAAMQAYAAERTARAGQDASEGGDTVSISAEARKLFAAMGSGGGAEEAGAAPAGGGAGGAAGGSSSEDIQSQIAALQARVASLTTRMEAGEEGVSGQIAALQAEIASLQAQLAA